MWEDYSLGCSFQLFVCLSVHAMHTLHIGYRESDSAYENDAIVITVASLINVFARKRAAAKVKYGHEKDPVLSFAPASGSRIQNEGPKEQHRFSPIGHMNASLAVDYVVDVRYPPHAVTE